MTRNRKRAYSLAALALSIALSTAPAYHIHAQTTAPATQVDSKLIQLTLVSKIDSKSAKVGDPVVTKTTSKIEVGGVVFPSGTRFTGKVTAASRQPASVSIEIDSMQTKGQLPIPVQTSIIAVAPPADSESQMSLPKQGGYMNPNPVSYNNSNSNGADALTGTGSMIKNVILEESSFTSDKDFKLESGSRIAINLSATTKQ
jgi:hypothetical protein